MPRRIVTVSYTGLNASGGVPAFNRALHVAFPDRECLHYCWEDVTDYDSPDSYPTYDLLPEWDRAKFLNYDLVRTRRVTPDDVVIADGFWAAGLEHLPLAVSHSHGIWSHLTHTDVAAGKQPDMPHHHAAQVAFRKRWVRLGKRLTSVSEFIAQQMRIQWGFWPHVINNGVVVPDPVTLPLRRPNPRPLIVHGVNDRTNLNKGWDHIEFMQRELGSTCDIILLDDLMRQGTGTWHDLWQADLMVHPSAFEGNSMLVAQALACGLPVVGYDVGYLYHVRNDYDGVIDRRQRSPAFTTAAVASLLCNHQLQTRLTMLGRKLVEWDLSNEVFIRNWRGYISEMEAKMETGHDA